MEASKALTIVQCTALKEIRRETLLSTSPVRSHFEKFYNLFVSVCFNWENDDLPLPMNFKARNAGKVDQFVQ